MRQAQVTQASRSAGVRLEFVAARPIRGRYFSLEEGEPFPFQDRAIIRGLGPALGVLDADRRDWSDLDYVRGRAGIRW
jgi:hypothetical protein